MNLKKPYSSLHTKWQRWRSQRAPFLFSYSDSWKSVPDPFPSVNTDADAQCEQECIPVGCVPPAHWPYLIVSHVCTSLQPCTPPSQPRMPPQPRMLPATMHTPLATTHAPHNHACSLQPCTSPGNHTSPPTTTHTPWQPRMPPGNHARPRQPCMPPLWTESQTPVKI